MTKQLFLITSMILFSSALFALSVVSPFMMEVESGVTWVHNEAYGAGGSGDRGPDPILYRVGVAFPVYFDELLFIRPSLTFISKSWQYVDDNSWAMPVDPMWQDLLVMSFLIDVPIGYEIKYESFSLAFFGGPALNFRTPLWGDNNSVRGDMGKYFFREFRFFNLMAGFYFNIPLTERVSLTMKGDTWIPVHNLWSSSGLPFSDGLMVTISAGIRFIF